MKTFDIKKLEKLSMLSIDSKIENDLNDVIAVAECMSQSHVAQLTISIQLEYLG